MDGRAPLLEAVRRDARGVAAAKQKTWTRRALIAAFVCVLMYVHYRTMHALAAFSTEALSDAEKQGARAVDESRARAGATRERRYHDQAGDTYDTNVGVGGVDVTDNLESTPDSPGVPDPPGVPGVPPVPSEQSAPETVGDEEDDRFVALNTGTFMPRIGFGTAGLGPETTQAVEWALRAGYRLIDSAQAREWYREDLVGNAVVKSGILRSELFLTSKLHPRHLGYERTLQQFQTSLDDLHTEYMDLFMLHYPKCWGSLCDTEPEGTWVDSWRALEELYNDGKVKAIGVSNFDLHELEELQKIAKVQPAVVQRNCDIFAQDVNTRVFVTSQGWQYEAYSSLGTQWLMKGHAKNPVLGSPIVVAIAERRGVSPAAVCLRWALDKKQIIIPKSSNEKRIAENLNMVWSMGKLTEGEMDELDKLDGHPPFVEF